MAADGVQLSDEELQALAEARKRAQTLLDELRQRQAELEGNASPLPPDKLMEGRAAMQKAITSAQRMVDNLDKALQLARGPLN